MRSRRTRLAGWYEREVPEYDPAELDLLLTRAKARSTVLSARRRRAVRVLSVLTAVLVIGTSVAVATTLGGRGSPTSPDRPLASGLRWALAGYVGSPWKGTAGRGLTVLGPNIHGLTCSSVTTCYTEGAGMGGQGLRVEATDNGGKTWHLGGLEGAAALSNVACPSARVCALLEETTDNPPINKPVFVETTDGGATWRARPAPSWLIPFENVKHEGSYYTLGLITLSCRTTYSCTFLASSGTPSSRSVASVTMDDGRTWSSPTPEFKTSLELQCFANGKCLSAGYSGLAYSTDSGLRWTRSSGWPSEELPYFSCATPANCIALSRPLTGGGASLLVSSDGGESWSSVKTQGLLAGKWFTSMACPTSSECWLSGDTVLANPVRILDEGEVLLSSANGGRTWSAGALPRGVSAVWNVSCPGPSTCFALATKPSPPPGPSETSPVFPAAVLLVHQGRAQ